MTRNAFKLGLLEFLIKWPNLCTWNFQGILLEFQRAQENLIWRKLYCWHPIDQKIFANTFPPTSVAFPLFSSFFLYFLNIFIGVSVRFSLSVVSNSLPPMDCSTQGFSVHHQLLELAHTHVQWVCDAIQPTHPLLSPSPPAFNLAQHLGPFQWVSSSHQVVQGIGVSDSASGLAVNIKDWFPLGWTGWISLQSKGFSRVFSYTTVRNHQFFGAQLSLQSNSHIHTRLLEKS